MIWSRRAQTSQFPLIGPGSVFGGANSSTRKTRQSDNGSGPGDSGFWRAFNTSRIGVLLQRPPSQYDVPFSSVAGKHGGKLQLASLEVKVISRLNSRRRFGFLSFSTNRAFELFFAHGIFSRCTYQSGEAAFRSNGNGLDWFARKISAKPTSHAPKPMLGQRAP
jgi:hypothetical protein